VTTKGRHTSVIDMTGMCTPSSDEVCISGGGDPDSEYLYYDQDEGDGPPPEFE